MKKKIAIASIIIIVLIIAITYFVKQNNNEQVVNEKSKITIGVYNKENSNIYNKEIETEQEYLIDVLKDIEELKVVTEDSQYGDYIISIMGIEQSDNYYWTYYINDKYAEVGISSCKIEDGVIYNLKMESFNY